MNEEWDIVIKPKNKWYDLRIKEIYKYRDLLFLFVRRDFVSLYKQTILGPVWFVLQPLITTFTFTIVFGKLANISTNELPTFLFYLSGITLWNYFSDTLNKTSDTFTSNSSIFGKVYFPRLIAPLSIVVSNLIKFGIQFFLFIVVWIYFLNRMPDIIKPNWALILIPYLIFLMGLLGLSIGIISSSLTTKYRDLKFLIGFGVQLLMYASPIVYPLSIVPARYKIFVLANPVTSIIETFKYAFLGVGEFEFIYLVYSTITAVFLFIIGLIVFHKVEKSFMDNV